MILESLLIHEVYLYKRKRATNQYGEEKTYFDFSSPSDTITCRVEYSSSLAREFFEGEYLADTITIYCNDKGLAEIEDCIVFNNEKFIIVSIIPHFLSSSEPVYYTISARKYDYS